MAVSKTIAQRALIIYCDHCFKTITLGPFIKCNECSWNLCPSCFAIGLETEEHKSTHTYRVVANLDEPLSSPEWRAIDELLLLNCIATAGIGNIEDIAAAFPNKDKKDVKRHMYTILGISDNEEGEVEYETVPKSNPNDAVILGYMPKRKDFDSEIFNEYEGLLAQLEFSGNDTLLETRLKKYMLAHYKVVLRRRAMWKTYIHDRNLLDLKRLKRIDINELGSVISRYKWLVQYLSKRDFNKFINGLIKELRLRSSKMQAGSCLMDERRLYNVEDLLSKNEKELCRRLCIPCTLYTSLKRLAIECFVTKRPFKNVLFSLFNPSESKRIEVLYRWFKSHNAVYTCEK